MSTGQPTFPPVIETHLPLPGRRQGKVRDIYSLPPTNGQPGRVVIVASDRISAFDVVLPTPIPGKGRLLTEISVQWFEFIRDLGVISDHLISVDPGTLEQLNDAQQEEIEGRVMIGRAAQVIPIECVARGYITGSGWSEYKKQGTVCGIPLPKGLVDCQKLPEPIFTPATKADVGHDENIDFERACSIAGKAVMQTLREVTLTIYKEAARYAEKRGIILADTKFEFGYALDADGKPTDEIILIDEALTPDSSRFWPAEEYEAGRAQRSFDKQYVRDYLQSLVNEKKWDKTPPGPQLPEEIVQNTLSRYREARDSLFG